MKGKGDEEGSKGRKRRRNKEEEGETTPRSQLPGSALTARWLSPVSLRLRGGGLRRRAARDVIAPRRLPARCFPRPGVVPPRGAGAWPHWRVPLPLGGCESLGLWLSARPAPVAAGRR